MTPAADATLLRVAHAAANLKAARKELKVTIVAASTDGWSLRPIANAAGASVEWTRQTIASNSDRRRLTRDSR